MMSKPCKTFNSWPSTSIDKKSTLLFLNGDVLITLFKVFVLIFLTDCKGAFWKFLTFSLIVFIGDFSW